MTMIYPKYTQISWYFSLNNVKKVFFTLWLSVFTLFDSLTSSGKPFQIKGPNYDKHFWLRALVHSGWKSSCNSIVLIGCSVNFFHILRTHFREEFKNAFRKTLLEFLVYWKPANLVKMVSSDVLHVVQL